MGSPLFRTKPLGTLLEDTEDEGHRLRRALGPWDLVAIGIGCIIGVGIFVLPGVEAATHAGPASSSRSPSRPPPAPAPRCATPSSRR